MTPLTDHPPPQVRRIAAGGSRLFVAPGGRLVQRRLGQGQRLRGRAFVNGAFRALPRTGGGHFVAERGSPNGSDADALRAGIISWKLEQ